jgi:formylglycine-generating enzyme required for sulfatase activity
MINRIVKFLLAVLFLAVVPYRIAAANNVSINNVMLTEPSSVEKTLKIQFDVSWDNSWRNNTNHDALWVFAKYSKDSGATWAHVTLKNAGTNPQGFQQASGTALDIVVPSDKKGAFLRRAASGSGTASATGMQLVWDWGTDVLAESDSVIVRVFAIEMVYIPSAPFSVGDKAVSVASLKQGVSDTDPWLVSSESQIDVTQILSNGFYYVSAGNSSEASTGSSFVIPSDFPKGYRAFYAMRYEISEGQWVDFFNTLTPAQKATRDITSNTGKNSDDVVDRNTISWTSGNATTSRPERACSYLSWMDMCAYADWAALRPMTELEFEKVCRGSQPVTPEERAWGGTVQVPPAPNGISGAEDGTERIVTSNANCNYGRITFASGDTGTGPLRCGIFATATSNRISAGAGYYGVMDLSGNLWERTVTIGNPQGRGFTGSHGDGVLTITAGHEGNATNSDWPGLDTALANGITTATGSGFRGGSWDTDAAYLRTSDRSKAALTSNIRASDYGGRLGRTAP